MCTSRGEEGRLRLALSLLISAWLGLGPLLAAHPLWAVETDCCCGGESVCLLGGCDCGRAGTARLGECGGVRSADGANDDAVALSLARHAGLIPIDSPVEPLLPSGRIDVGGAEDQNLPARAPDPPPPRPFGAL